MQSQYRRVDSAQGLAGARAWCSSVLTVSESPRAATTLMSAGRSSWTRTDRQKDGGQVEVFLLKYKLG